MRFFPGCIFWLPSPSVFLSFYLLAPWWVFFLCVIRVALNFQACFIFWGRWHLVHSCSCKCDTGAMHPQFSGWPKELESLNCFWRFTALGGDFAPLNLAANAIYIGHWYGFRNPKRVRQSCSWYSTEYRRIISPPLPDNLQYYCV